jgi:hypothetical protein
MPKANPERLQRQLVLSDNISQSDEHGLSAVAVLLNEVELLLIGAERCQTLFRRGISLVRNIVRTAGKSINDFDCRS